MQSILIIDDEAEVGRALRRVLERAGYAVTITTGSADGLAAFARHPADVVIADIVMPKTHGIDLIKAIRQHVAAATRIIAISGGGNFGPLAYQPEAITTTAYLAAAREAGADEVLTKPFDKEDLLDAVKRLLAR